MTRPYVFLCTAMSLDGKISTFDRKQAEIATDDDKELTYICRIEADAVFIGAGQLRLDDPKLTVKTEERRQKRLAAGKTREPMKVVVISDLSTIKNRDGDFFSTGEKRVLFTTNKTSKSDLDFFRKKADVFVFGEDKVDLKRSMEKLYELGVKKVMVEGGGELIFSLLNDHLVDEIRLKIGNLILGGRAAPTLADGEGFLQGNALKVRFGDLVRKDNYIILKCYPVYEK